MKKRMIILLQIIIAVVLIGTSVYASVSATLDLNVSSNTLKKGDEVTVTLSLKDVNSEQKVSSISGYINYNHDVIEEVTVNNIVKESNNTISIGNETLSVEDLTNRDIEDMPNTSAYVGFNGAPTSNNDIKIVIDFDRGITENDDLFTMKFKVKSNASLGEIENAIEYKMFVITAGTSEKSEEITKNVTLTITNSDSNNNNENETNRNETNRNETGRNELGTNQDGKNETNKNNNTNNNTNTNKTSNGNNKKDNTLSSNVLPATGARAIILPAIILILCSYIFYNRYMKYKGI